MEEILSRATTIMYLSAIATLVLTSIKTAPYGRYASSSQTLPARIAWVIFETPNLIIPPSLMLVLSNAPLPPVNQTLLAFFLLHYIHRALIYPCLRLPKTATPMPVHVVLSATLFCCCNASLQSLALLLHRYPDSWFYDPRFVIGIPTALIGMTINIYSDSVLLRLRKTGHYQVPKGALFRFVSCPNFLGEILEWSGWAIACWSHAAASFALFTFCNTAPRACSHHHYYRRKFEHYPNDRKALIPFVF